LIIARVRTIINEVNLNTLSIVDASEKNKLTLLMFVFIVVGYFISVIWPIYLSFKRPPEDTTPEKILDTVEQIIEDPEGYQIIMKLSQIRQSAEMPPLLREIVRFRQITDPDVLKQKADEIYNQFIKSGAPQQNNFSASMVEDIHGRLDAPTSDLFNGPYRELMKLMNTHTNDVEQSSPKVVCGERERLVKKSHFFFCCC